MIFFKVRGLLLLSHFSRVGLCETHRWLPTRLPRPWDSPGKNTGVGCHFLLQCMKVKGESEVTQSRPLLATSWAAAYQAPPSMGFSRQEYWSGVPLPSPGLSSLVLDFLRRSPEDHLILLFHLKDEEDIILEFVL